MSVEQEIEMLARLPMFGQLEDEALRVLAFALDSVRLSTGDYLFKKGDLSEAGYFVLSGSIAIIKDNIEARIVYPGALIGEMALLAQSRLRYAAQAREQVSVLKISRTLFTRILREYPGSAIRIRAAIEDSLNAFVTELDKFESGARLG